MRKLKRSLRDLHSSQKSVGKLGQNCVYLSVQSAPKCVLEQHFLQAITCSLLEHKEQMRQCHVDLVNKILQMCTVCERDSA